MAGRTNYTYTAIYNRSFAKPGRFSAAGAGRSYALEPLYRDEERTGRGDTPVLALLFFVLPILGLFAILIQPMRWIFCAGAALSLLTMWGLKCFMPRARAVTSIVLTALIALSVYGALVAPSDSLTYLGNNLTGPTPTPDASALTAGGVIDPSLTADLTALSAQVSQPPDKAVSPAETVLLSYLELWKQGNNTEEMVKLTWPEWRRSVESANMTLFTAYANKKLIDWEYTMPPVSDMDTVVSVPVIAQLVTQHDVTARFSFGAMLYRVDDTWYVDPSSLKSGVPIIEATATPNPDATPKPTPTPAVSQSLKLWYNSAGGEYYHTKNNCPTIAARFVSKMSSFTYSQIKDRNYSKLKPCLTCGAPPRP